MINTILAIAAGGALGAVMRYGVNVGASKWLGHGFPYGTLTVNVLGSFIIGILVVVFAHLWQPSESIRFFIVTGVLGAFTTFSTFSLDFASLIERHEYLAGSVYLGTSVIASIAALFIGMAITRGLIS